MTSGKLKRHHGLDLLRGLAALAVAQYHFMSWNGVAVVESMGTFAVYLFFTLSALTMMMVYGERFADRLEAPAVTDFFRKRFARLLPLLALIAVLSYAKDLFFGDPDPVKALLTGSGLLALQMPGFLSNSIGAWSLGIELAFYAVFPIICLLARSARMVMIWTAVLLLAQHALLWRIGTVEPFWPYYISHLTFAPFFALGILISFDKGERRSSWLVAAIGALVVLVGYSAIFPGDLMRDQASYILLTLVAAGAVWAAWRAEVPDWLVKPATFFGNISYSLYLTHWIANDVARLWGWPLSVQWMVFTGLAMGGAIATYRRFEDPLRKKLGARAVSAPRYEASTLP